MKKLNLVLGHVIAYLLEVKHNISYYIELYHITLHFTNHSFHSFFSEKRKPTHAAQQVGEDAHPRIAFSSPPSAT